MCMSLEELSTHTGTRAIEARRLHHQIATFSFVLSLCLIDKLFSITGKLSDLLQSEQINYAAAATCIEATKTTSTSLRTESEWQKIYDTAVEIAESNNISIPLTQQRRRAPPASLSSIAIQETTGMRANIGEYRTSIFYATIDSLIGELNSRFSETNIAILQSLQSLIPSSSSFFHVLPFLNHYDINVDSITAEMAVAINFLKEASPLSSIHDVYGHLYKAKNCFPDTIKVLQIAMTIGITTASAERSFSSLRRQDYY